MPDLNIPKGAALLAELCEVDVNGAQSMMTFNYCNSAD
jgi:hypothetical protein